MESLESILAKLTACDGIPFSLFRTSTALRTCITARLVELGLKDSLPKSDYGIKSLVFAYADRMRGILKKA